MQKINNNKKDEDGIIEKEKISLLINFLPSCLKGNFLKFLGLNENYLNEEVEVKVESKGEGQLDEVNLSNNKINNIGFNSLVDKKKENSYSNKKGKSNSNNNNKKENKLLDGQKTLLSMFNKEK